MPNFAHDADQDPQQLNTYTRYWDILFFAYAGIRSFVSSKIYTSNINNMLLWTLAFLLYNSEAVISFKLERRQLALTLRF